MPHVGLIELVAGPGEGVWLEIKEILIRRHPLSPQLGVGGGVEWR